MRKKRLGDRIPQPKHAIANSAATWRMQTKSDFAFYQLTSVLVTVEIVNCVPAVFKCC